MLPWKITNNNICIPTCILYLLKSTRTAIQVPPASIQFSTSSSTHWAILVMATPDRSLVRTPSSRKQRVIVCHLNSMLTPDPGQRKKICLIECSYPLPSGRWVQFVRLTVSVAMYTISLWRLHVKWLCPVTPKDNWSLSCLHGSIVALCCAVLNF